MKIKAKKRKNGYPDMVHFDITIESSEHTTMNLSEDYYNKIKSRPLYLKDIITNHIVNSIEIEIEETDDE